MNESDLAELHERTFRPFTRKDRERILSYLLDCQRGRPEGGGFRDDVEQADYGRRLNEGVVDDASFVLACAEHLDPEGLATASELPRELIVPFFQCRWLSRVLPDG